jgi:hypothetical protein
MDRRQFLTASAAAALTIPIFAPGASMAQNFSGQTVTIIVPFGVGGGNDLWGRFLASVMGKYLPGNPTMIVRNVPGRGVHHWREPVRRHGEAGWPYAARQLRLDPVSVPPRGEERQVRLRQVEVRTGRPHRRRRIHHQQAWRGPQVPEQAEGPHHPLREQRQ